METCEEHFALLGVQVTGSGSSVPELGGVLEIGRGVAGSMGGVPADALEDYVAQAARKRLGYIVEPTRIASWDHRKLLPATA